MKAWSIRSRIVFFAAQCGWLWFVEPKLLACYQSERPLAANVLQTAPPYFLVPGTAQAAGRATPLRRGTPTSILRRRTARQAEDLTRTLVMKSFTLGLLLY